MATNSAPSSGPSSFGPLPNPAQTAGDLAYQKYQMGLVARGSTLGIGRRTTPPVDSQFTSPPLSGSQFGTGSAKSTINSEV